MFKIILCAIVFSGVNVSAADLQLINVTGFADKYIEPNIVVVSVDTYGKADLAKMAQDRQSVEYKRVKLAVEKFKIKKEDFLTEGMSLAPEYKYDEKSQSNRTIGYRVSHQIKIIVRQKSDVGNFLDALSSINKADISGVLVNSISWDNDSRKLVSEGLVSEAVADGRKKADLLAAAAGVKIKAVQSMSYQETTNNNESILRDYSKAKMSFSQANNSTELGAGTIKVRTEVSLQYRIE